jgi:hypothetical protein
MGNFNGIWNSFTACRGLESTYNKGGTTMGKLQTGFNSISMSSSGGLFMKTEMNLP